MKTVPVTFALTLTAVLAATMLVSGCNKSPQVADAPRVVSETATSTANTPAAAGAVASGNVSDVDVTQHVQTALLQNDLLKGSDISVVTVKGDVRLVGALDSQAQIDEANRIARSSDGVHAVHDELTIKK
jgi:osmotically-inducible protein OsmY